jgi:uncharacterized protein YggE
MTKIIGAVKKLGVADADIQTVGLSLYPQYGSGSRPKVVGYTISNQLQITIRDLDNTGDIVDAATASGATDVNGISFELSDPAKAMNDARASAVTAAQASAQAMATAAHVTLGSVVSITDATPATPVYYGAARGAALDSLATPIKVGTQDLSVMVTVVFAIE